ncbi:MAG: chain length determinant protein [Deltaproteobacteria bacterium]|nr:chain length determinant protein [Deltaproteobacteria bacterium]
MEVQDDEINLMDLWKVIWKRKSLIIALTLSFAILALSVSLNSPKVYEGEAVVALPKVGISFVETKTITDAMLKEVKRGNPLGGFEETLIKKISDIRIEQIKGSDSQFKILVSIKREPYAAYEVFNKIMAYMQGNEYVKKRMDIEKKAIERNVSETRQTIEMAEKTRNEAVRLMSTRNPVGFNPVDLDVRIGELKAKLTGLETNLSLLNSYEFISGPYIYKNKVKPKVRLNTLIAGMVGLFVGMLLAFALEGFEKRRTEI